MSAINLIGSADSIAQPVGAYTIAGSPVADVVLVGVAFTDSASNTVTPKSPARRIWVGTAGSGNLHVVYASGVDAILTKIPAQSYVDGQFVKIIAATTDVQDIRIEW